jgi:hypothetical protein
MKTKILLLCFMLPVGTATGFAQYSGLCNENISWLLNTSDSILTISGSGDMPDYEGAPDPPWELKEHWIKKIVIGGGITGIGGYSFVLCHNLKEIVMPEGLKTIGWGAFTGNDRLKEIWFPSTLESIGGQAFDNCGLTTITIPGNIKTIGDGAFVSCLNLETVTIQDGVENIGEAAFSGCRKLLSVSIPNSIKYIGNDAFKQCVSLNSDITISGSVSKIGAGAFTDCSALNSININEGVDSIGSGAFSGCAKLEAVAIPQSVKHIGSSVFGNCSSLKTVNIPNGIEKIEPGTFSGCSELVSIVIPGSVTTIYGSAFSGCSKLDSITIPADVATISSGAFANCTNLKVLKVLNPEPPDIYPRTFQNLDLSSITLFVPAESVDKYKADVYWKEFEIIKGIDGSSSEPCDMPAASGAIGNINWILCPDGKLTISGEGPMPDYNYDSPWEEYKPLITDIVIEEGVASIGNTAFSVCGNLTYINIPSTVASIGYQAFGWCDGLPSFNVASDNPYYCSDNGILFNKDKTVLVRYPAGRLDDNYVIPEGVESIGQAAFSDSYHLKSITIANTVTSIGREAFFQCLSLEEVILSRSVEEIKVQAFFYCNITSIIIPANVTSIEAGAFGRCRNLKEVEVEWETPLLISESVFSEVELSEATLLVPAGTENEYKSVAVWQDFGRIKDATTGINLLTEEAAISIYPNPVTDRLYIQSPVAIRQVVVYNTNGSILLQQENLGNSINVSTLPQGVYMLKIVTAEGEITRKIVK